MNSLLTGFKGAFHFRTARYPWGKAAGAALTMGICIYIGAVVGHVMWGLLAAVGGFASVYVHNEPYAQRAVKLAVVSVGLAACLGLGTLSAGHLWSMAISFGLVSMGATFFAGAWKVPPPSGYYFILVYALGTGLPLHPSEALMRSGLALLGGGVAWVICMFGWFLHPHKPETSAVANAYGEVATFLATTQHVDATRHNVAIALRASEEAVLSARQVRWRQPGTSYRLFLMHERVKSMFLAGIAITAEGRGPIHPGLSSAVRRLSDAVKKHQNAQFIEIPKPMLDTPARWRAYRTLLDAVAIAKKPVAEFNPDFRSEKRSIRSVLLGALDRRSLLIRGVLRIGFVVMGATLIAYMFGNPRPYWVSLTCASVLQGTTVIATVHRTMQRAIGTAIGVVVAGAILSIHSSIALTIVALMALQWLAELMIVRNYGLAVIFITPLPLILAEAGNPHLQVSFLVQERLLDTLLGCVIGVTGGLLLWRRTSPVRLPSVISGAVRLQSQLLSTWLSRDTSSLLHLRESLLTALLNIRVVYDAATSALPRRESSLEALWPVIVAVQRMGYSIIAVSEHEPAGGSESNFRLRLTTVFDELAMAIEQGNAARLGEFPGVPGFPAISYEWNALREALEDGATNVASI